MSWRPATNPISWIDRLPAKIRRPLRALLLLLFLGGGAALALVLIYGGLAMRYNLDEISAIPARTTIHDSHGVELDSGYGVKRRIISRKQIRSFMVSALLAREDMRFYKHHGADLRGLLRATLRNIRDCSFTQGASTLTMQLARNTFDIRAKSLHRKFLEIALTLRIEHRFTKDEILTHYLNRIYFGAGCYGVEEAAQTYFGKSASSLHAGECAMLVGIIRGPHIFSPFHDFDAALAQRDQVLERMRAVGFIDSERMEKIRAMPIVLVPDEQRHTERSYALQCVDSEKDLILSKSDISEGGLKITTTLDASWQILLEKELEKAAESLESRPGWPHPTFQAHHPGETPKYLQFAAVTLDTDSGGILAWIGGRDFLDSRFDRARGVRRDLGSAFEPFVAAAASERSRLVLPGKPLQTGRQIGPAEVERIARRCGITGPFSHTEDLFRGTAAASPLELAIALATLGNDGQRPKPYIIEDIRGRTGRTLYQATPDLSPAISPDTASEALGLFEKIQKDGASPVFIASGTNGRDGWILRLGHSGATAIWIGFDKPAKTLPRTELERFLKRLASRLGRL
jgi:penicillin-binding protein 1A